MSELRELYQQVILDHSRQPRNSGKLDDANRRAEGYNPLCGDRVVLYVQVDDAGTIEDLRFEGQGCAISTAAASTLTEAVKGRTEAEIEELFGRFHDLVTGREDPEALIDHGKLAAFGGVAAFPMRVKCATLAWHTLQNALEAKGELATTEV